MERHKMYWDTHIHTIYSDDGHVPVTDMIRACKDKGLSGMIITDHNDFDHPCDAKNIEYDSYFKYITPIKESFSNNDFTVGVGVELGLQEHVTELNKNLLNKYPFDYCIGSIHAVDGMDPYLDDFYEGYDLQERVNFIYQTTIKNLKLFPSIDSLGHLDYVIRYSTRYALSHNMKPVKSEPNDYVMEILSFLVGHNIALEVNTGSFRNLLSEPNPCYAILTEYYKMGGRLITLGSDAHQIPQIAMEFNQVIPKLKEIGFKSFFVFLKRSPMELPL